MSAHQSRPGGEGLPTSDTTHGANVGRIEGQQTEVDEWDSRTVPNAREALRVIEGERKARDYLARLHTEQTDPDELALIVAALYGAALRGFARAIEKELGGRHA